MTLTKKAKVVEALGSPSRGSLDGVPQASDQPQARRRKSGCGMTNGEFARFALHALDGGDDAAGIHLLDIEAHGGDVLRSSWVFRASNMSI